MVMGEESGAPEALACTVIVCTYNRADRLPYCLEALAAQDFDPDCFELIVVDNASKDATRQVVEAWLPKFRHARYVYEGEQGLSAARNRGIAEAKGRIVVFTDDDCVPQALWLRSMAAPFDEQADVGVTVGKIVPDFEEEPPPWLDMQSVGLVLACLDRGDVRRDLVPEDARGASVAFRQAALMEVGQFRTDLGMRGNLLLGSEETEMCARICARGFRIVYTPQAMVLHHIPQDRLKEDYYLSRWYGQGRSEYWKTRERAASLEGSSGWLAATWRIVDAFRQFYIARRRLRWLQRTASRPYNARMFDLICTRSREAGFHYEEMSHAMIKFSRRRVALSVRES